MTAARASWQTIISGIPTINRFCFVLWRNFFIEIYIPIEPPMSETKNSVGSEMRRLPFSAFFLSENAIMKPIMFIIIKYAATNAATGCCFKISIDSPVKKSSQRRFSSLRRYIGLLKNKLIPCFRHRLRVQKRLHRPFRERLVHLRSEQFHLIPKLPRCSRQGC